MTSLQRVQKLFLQSTKIDHYIHKNKIWAKRVSRLAGGIHACWEANNSLDIGGFIFPEAVQVHDSGYHVIFSFWNIFAKTVTELGNTRLLEKLSHTLRVVIQAYVSSDVEIVTITQAWHEKGWILPISSPASSSTQPPAQGIPSTQEVATTLPNITVASSPNIKNAPTPQKVPLNQRVSPSLVAILKKLPQHLRVALVRAISRSYQDNTIFWSFELAIDAFSISDLQNWIPNEWEELESFLATHRSAQQSSWEMATFGITQLGKMPKPSALALKREIHSLQLAELQPPKKHKVTNFVKLDSKSSISVSSTQALELPQREKAASQVFDIVKAIGNSTFLQRFGTTDTFKVRWAIEFPIKNRRASSTWGKLSFFRKFHEKVRSLDLKLLQLSMACILCIWTAFEKDTKMQLHSFIKNIKWIKTYLGIPIPELDDIFSKVPKNISMSRNLRGKADPIQLFHCCHLEKIVEQEILGKKIRFVASCILLATYSSLRVQDVMRLKITKIDETNLVLEGVLYNSKNPRGDGGEQRVYLFLGHLIYPHWWTPLKDALGVDRDYLLPDIHGERCKPPYQNSTMYRWVPCPMKHHSFICWINYMMRQPSEVSWMLKCDAAYSFTARGHSPRRMVPTVCDILNISVEHSQLMGRWSQNSKAMSRQYSAAPREVTLRVPRFLMMSLQYTVQMAIRQQKSPLFEHIVPHPQESLLHSSSITTPGDAAPSSSPSIPVNLSTEDDDRSCDMDIDEDNEKKDPDYVLSSSENSDYDSYDSELEWAAEPYFGVRK